MLMVIDAHIIRSFHDDIRKAGFGGMVKVEMSEDAMRRQGFNVRFMCREYRKEGEEVVWTYTDNAHRFHMEGNLLLIDEWNAVEMKGEDEYSKIPLSDILQIQVIREADAKKRIRRKVLATYTLRLDRVTRRSS